MNRLLSVVCTFAVLCAASASAAPPPAGSATRSGATRSGATLSAYTSATCPIGFTPKPASYPTLSQNVKYQCFSAALTCPASSSATDPDMTIAPVTFKYTCKAGDFQGVTLTCAAGFTPSAPTTYVIDPNAEMGSSYEVYDCHTKAVTACPSGFDLIEGDIVGAPLKIFYACISSGPH